MPRRHMPPSPDVGCGPGPPWPAHAGAQASPPYRGRTGRGWPRLGRARALLAGPEGAHAHPGWPRGYFQGRSFTPAGRRKEREENRRRERQRRHPTTPPGQEAPHPPHDILPPNSRARRLLDKGRRTRLKSKTARSGTGWGERRADTSFDDGGALNGQKQQQHRRHMAIRGGAAALWSVCSWRCSTASRRRWATRAAPRRPQPPAPR